MLQVVVVVEVFRLIRLVFCFIVQEVIVIKINFIYNFIISYICTSIRLRLVINVILISRYY